MENIVRLYHWSGINWDIQSDAWDNLFGVPLCPKQKCNCALTKSKEGYVRGEYKYVCVKCDFKITLNKSIEDKSDDLVKILDSNKYRDAEIINIDGELIRIQKEEIREDGYWISVSLSRNKKDDLQLMVLAGDRTGKHKTQLFADVSRERLAFDQNNAHPKEIFSKVEATFKNSKSSIKTKTCTKVSE